MITNFTFRLASNSPPVFYLFTLQHLKPYYYYLQKDLFELLNEMTDRLGLFQFVEFNTWERVVQNLIKTSILDHI